ncbi:hypothetical protein PENARI_c070G03503 [Penicillium arizonense]|uniref:Uncharacterized protein n=1 Tax=Penicillium arizonense TaxID=1835702 RepID=A0A1F5L1X6_PENAI|nr:hypothetical protein PENARI_c070G03503 [Penicillium arizonense]OGE47056.1 hypothetical protein PENARI_c070G03503 [Penicillium arizonense]
MVNADLPATVPTVYGQSTHSIEPSFTDDRQQPTLPVCRHPETPQNSYEQDLPFSSDTGSSARIDVFSLNKSVSPFSQRAGIVPNIHVEGTDLENYDSALAVNEHFSNRIDGDPVISQTLFSRFDSEPSIEGALFAPFDSDPAIKRVLFSQGLEIL